jgi:hypothetical protein
MRFLFLLFLPLIASGQCETDRTGRAYLALPSFFSLYFNGQCVERNMGDTTICVKFPPQSVGQVAGFSYSSPSGQPAFVTAVNQYTTDCILIEQSPLIYPSSDTVVVCYTIDAILIDNFCPYAILSGGLAVEWCGIESRYEQNHIDLHFATCSNAGTNRFEVIVSDDLIQWQTIFKTCAKYVNSSDRTDYFLNVPYTTAGQHYLAIREIDYEGRTNVSDPVVFTVPLTVQDKPRFDILGRSVQDNTYLYYVGSNGR